MLFYEDKDRLLINNMQGLYNRFAQRTTLASTAGQSYYIKLRACYNDDYIPILSESYNLQNCCYMDTLANIIS